METVTIKIKLDNAAFENPGELPRILRKLAKDCEENGFQKMVLRDINGNKVGSVEWEG